MLEKFFKPKIDIELIRIGPNSDGGYFIPKKFIKLPKNLIACGLGYNWEFEKEYLKLNKKVKIIAYDHSVNILGFVKHFLFSLIFAFRFRKNFKELFKYIDYIFFFNKKNVSHKKLRINNNKKKITNINLDEVLKKYKDILLKIDIEGDEYKILDSITKHEKKIFCLIIEFHEINKNKSKIKNFLNKSNLLNCNICPNNSSGFDYKKNPRTIEMTLINKKLFKKNDLKKGNLSKCFPNNPYKVNYDIRFSTN